VEPTTDFLEHLIEEEQKIRQRAEEYGIHIGAEPSEEAKAPFRPKEGIPRTELTDRELSSLFAETKDVLDIYTEDYIAEHFDEAQSLYESLLDKPFSSDTLIGSRTVKNIEELKTRIDIVRERESPAKPLEELLSDAKRLLDSLETYESEEAKRKYADLLRREDSLPKNVDKPLELEIQEYLTEIGKRIQRTEKKSTEEVGEELLEEISSLMGSGAFDPEGYNKVAKKFQRVADSLPEDLRLKIRDRIRECYAKMKDTERKKAAENREREARTKKFYWDAFASDVEQLKADLDRATPGEFFRIHDMYNQILDSLENADLSGVPTVQVERVKSLLDQCFYALEELRTRA
jgi:DNA-binding ferritin-like protein (Dps family)